MKTIPHSQSFSLLCLSCISPVLFISCNSYPEKQENGKPNIVLILADDLGYGDISALNPSSLIYTPALDMLVKEGITFTEAHSSASVSTPSRYGILTGRYAFRSENAAFGVWGFNHPVIESERETIASLLNKAGYITACIGKWHLGLGWKTKDGSEQASFNPETGFSNADYSQDLKSGPNNYGFNYSFILPASLDMPPYVFIKNHQVIDKNIILNTNVYPTSQINTKYSWDRKHTKGYDIYWEKGVWWRRGEMSGSFRIENCLGEIVREGITFIDKHVQANPETPFFLYLPLTGPHTPWVPTSKFKGTSQIGLYGDFVMEVDDVVNQVKETLRRNNVYENTILIFTSDNGAFWPLEEIESTNHDSHQGRRGQKGDIWDGGHRIPLIISWPECIKHARVCKKLVSLTDLFATFAELMDTELHENMAEDSYSFLHTIYDEEKKNERQTMIHHSSRGLYSIRVKGWKYIDGYGSGGFTVSNIENHLSDTPPGQLYFIEKDRMESDNLYDTNPGLVDELQYLLEGFKNTPERFKTN